MHVFDTTIALALLALPGSAIDTLRELIPDAIPGIGGSGPSAVDEETMDSYRTALKAVLEDDDQLARDEFRAVWERREEVGADGEGLDVVLPAGVALAALLRFQAERDVQPKEVLGLIEPHWERLTPPVVTLYEHVSGNYPNASQDAVPEVDGSIPEDLDELETAAFARLLDRHLDDEHTVGELYRASLQAMMHHRAELAVELQAEAWGRRDPESEEPPEEPILGAGVALAGHLDLLDDIDLDVDRDEIVATVEPHADRLSIAPSALFDRLSTGSSDTDPQWIVDEHVDVPAAEFDAESAELETLESLAHSNLLQTLRDREEEDPETDSDASSE